MVGPFGFFMRFARTRIGWCGSCFPLNLALLGFPYFSFVYQVIAQSPACVWFLAKGVVVGCGRIGTRRWGSGGCIANGPRILVVTTLVFANVLSIRVSNTAARGGPGYGERTCWAKFRPVLCEGLVAPWVSLLMGWILGAEDLSSDV